MKCPYRKKVKVYYDGAIRVTEVDFMECVKEKCPYWSAIVFNANECKWIYGCRKANKEC